MYPQCKIISQDFKKSNFTKNGLKTTQGLVSEVLDVKQRLHQIEMEMLKLHSKQLAMEKKDEKENDSFVEFWAAYVTFANEESVDKAVALSGTTFYSRTVKVLRKAEAASAATAPAQLSPKPFHTHGKRKAILTNHGIRALVYNGGESPALIQRKQNHHQLQLVSKLFPHLPPNIFLIQTKGGMLRQQSALQLKALNFQNDV